MKRLLLALVVVCGMAASTARAQGIAFQRAAALRRGINLSMWYAQAPNYSAERLTTYTTPEDFRLVKSLGCDHVRLSINPEPLMLGGRPDALDPEAMARLDTTVAQITSAGLVLILDIHPDPAYEIPLAQGAAPVKDLFDFWKSFAAHFAKSDPKQVYFEVLNEPEMDDGYRWAGIQAKAVAMIRALAPEHTIIATGADWGSVPGLLALEPVRDDNVIYSFHDYDPPTFTHQGATWAGPYLEVLHGVPYPSNPKNVAPLMGLETQDGGKSQLERYGEERWDAKRVDAEIAEAAAWGKLHQVPVWCGEFGVYRVYSDPAMRAAWLHDMRVSLEAHGIGWSMWDYQGTFSLVIKADGKTTVDAPIARALGLKIPRP